MPPVIRSGSFLFFFNDTPTPEIYTLSLHDALPICLPTEPQRPDRRSPLMSDRIGARKTDRKSTRLNSSHSSSSYAVFCLKKNKARRRGRRSSCADRGRCDRAAGYEHSRRDARRRRSRADHQGGQLLFFFFNDTATTEIYTLSLHDALPISVHSAARNSPGRTKTNGASRSA